MIKLIMTLVFSLSIISVGQAKELTFADYAKLPDLSMVVISPSGKRLAYRKVQDGKDMLLVIDLEAQKVIDGVNISSMKPDNIYFIDDDRLILVASKNSRLYGFRGRHDISVAFSYNLKNSKIFQLLTAGSYIYGGQSQLGNIIGVSPDKRYAYMPAWKSKGEYSLYKVDLTKRRRPIVYKKGTFDTIDFFVDKHGKVLARERFDNKSNLHSLEALHNGDWVRIFSEKTEIPKVSFNGVTPDGTKLVMISQDNDHGRWAYHTISLNDGTLSKPLFSREDRDVETVLTDINRVVFGVRYSGFKPSYEFFDDKLNRRMAGIDAILPDNAMRIDSYTPDWENIIFYLTGTNSSGEYYRYKKGGLNLLANARATITPDKVHPVEIINYKARDGLDIPALITLPLHHKAQNLPAIVLPHGGPESYDKLDFDWLTQYFASQGYVVIQPQFRGSKGFGTRHLFKGRGEWGRKMQDDLTDAVHALAKQGKIDPKRVCIVGASYGGYAALAGAAFTPDVYQCAVSINGVSDIERMMKTDRYQYGSSHWVVAYWDRVISNGNLDDNHLEKISPINFVKQIKTPVLLIHGERDLVVNVRQSRNMYDAMEDADKTVSFVELDKDDHYLSNANNRAQALAAIAKFIKRHI